MGTGERPAIKESYSAVTLAGRGGLMGESLGGSANFSASKISAGRYLVDMKEMKTGTRFTSAVILR